MHVSRFLSKHSSNKAYALVYVYVTLPGLFDKIDAVYQQQQQQQNRNSVHCSSLLEKPELELELEQMLRLIERISST
jgi:hypothetical protein